MGDAEWFVVCVRCEPGAGEPRPAVRAPMLDAILWMAEHRSSHHPQDRPKSLFAITLVCLLFSGRYAKADA